MLTFDIKKIVRYTISSLLDIHQTYIRKYTRRLVSEEHAKAHVIGIELKNKIEKELTLN